MKKEKRKAKEIKVDIKDTILKGLISVEIFKFSKISDMNEAIKNINSNVKLKLLINYNSSQFYIFKEITTDKLNTFDKSTKLKNNEIATLLKSFYSQSKFEWDNSFLKNTKKIKNEIAPLNFEVNNNYIKSDDKYINVITLEHLGNKTIVESVMDMDCWIVIDCYKVDNKLLLNKLMEMKNDNVIDKKFNSFIKSKLDHVLNKLKTETIFQSEIKILLYNSELEKLNDESIFIKKTLLKNDYVTYSPSERVNTRKLFEKCIYPNRNMDIIHSLSFKSLCKMIGSDNNV